MLPESKENIQLNSTLILIPVFDDWQAAFLLLTHLDEALHDKRIQAEVLFVDDASSSAMAQDEFLLPNLKSIQKVSVIELRRNFGHQRAIALGLAYRQNTKDDQT